MSFDLAAHRADRSLNKPPGRFVFQVKIRNKGREENRYATALLVSKQYGLFLSTTHVFTAHCEVAVYIPSSGNYVPLNVPASSIDWESSLALGQLAAQHTDLLDTYSEASFRGVTTNDKRAKISIDGFGDEDEHLLLNGRILWHQCPYGVTLPMLEEMWRAESKWFPTKEDREKLYKRFVLLSFGENSGAIASGSAVIDETGCVLGIVSRNDGTVGLAINAKDAEKLVITSCRRLQK